MYLFLFTWNLIKNIYYKWELNIVQSFLFLLQQVDEEKHILRGEQWEQGPVFLNL